MPGDIIVPRGTLDKYETGLPDSRIEQLWDRIRKELQFDRVDIQFATYIQPPRLAQKDGESVIMPETIVFLVVSENPHERYKGKPLKSFAFTTTQDWREAEAEAAHFAYRGDPAYGIFKEVSRQHLAARKHWEELI